VKIYSDIDQFIPVKNAVVTIGTFDGVHLGHRAILRKMIENAKEIGGQTIVVTFYPHPRSVLELNNEHLRFITTQEKKLQLLEEIGIDHVIIIPFTREFSRTSSEAFIKEYVVDKIKATRLVVGYDHHFGRNRLGDFKLLYDLSIKYQFKVERIPAQDIENIAISSTKIRKALEAGDVKKANKLLGYQYTICGTVIHGHALGRKMGFPTANIKTDLPYKLISFCGVYACFVEYKGQQYKGMANIGYRPTVGSDELATEVHLFDFDEEMYGETVCLRFIDRIRSEIKFDGIEALKTQLQLDKEAALKILSV